jgi:hypothetical protein
LPYFRSLRRGTRFAFGKPMALVGTRVFLKLTGGVTLEYLLVAMTIGLTTAFALLSAPPTVRQQQTKQATASYGPYP